MTPPIGTKQNSQRTELIPEQCLHVVTTPPQAGSMTKVDWRKQARCCHLVPEVSILIQAALFGCRSSSRSTRTSTLDKHLHHCQHHLLHHLLTSVHLPKSCPVLEKKQVNIFSRASEKHSESAPLKSQRRLEKHQTNFSLFFFNASASLTRSAEYKS